MVLNGIFSQDTTSSNWDFSCAIRFPFLTLSFPMQLISSWESSLPFNSLLIPKTFYRGPYLPEAQSPACDSPSTRINETCVVPERKTSSELPRLLSEPNLELQATLHRKVRAASARDAHTILWESSSAFPPPPREIQSSRITTRYFYLSYIAWHAQSHPDIFPQENMELNFKREEKYLFPTC